MRVLSTKFKTTNSSITTVRTELSLEKLKLNLVQSRLRAHNLKKTAVKTHFSLRRVSLENLKSWTRHSRKTILHSVHAASIEFSDWTNHYGNCCNKRHLLLPTLLGGRDYRCTEYLSGAWVRGVWVSGKPAYFIWIWFGGSGTYLAFYAQVSDTVLHQRPVTNNLCRLLTDYLWTQLLVAFVWVAFLDWLLAGIWLHFKPTKAYRAAEQTTSSTSYRHVAQWASYPKHQCNHRLHSACIAATSAHEHTQVSKQSSSVVDLIRI